MARGYDERFRLKVVEEAGRTSARRAAERFGIGVATAIRWVRQLRETGSLAERSSPKRGRLLDEHAEFLDDLRAASPHLSCQAVADRLFEAWGLRVHETTVWYWRRERGQSFQEGDGVR